MRLSKVAQAIATIDTNHSVLLYGQPGVGKTRLAGTAAQIDEFDNIYWVDLENGSQTLLNMGLTEAQMDKVVLIKIADTRDEPIGIETMLKLLTSKTPIKVCEAHGKVDCAVCSKAQQPSITFLLSSLTHRDLVVIDSGSQLGDSALAAACLGKPGMFKPTFDEYGMVNKWLGDCMSVIQQCKNTNFLVVTHEIALEDDEGKDKFFPLMGSKAFSMKCAKYFGTRVYVHKKLNKHTAGSSSTYRGDVLAASRVNAVIEKEDTLDLRAIFIKGGILRPRTTGPAPTISPAPAPANTDKLPIVQIADALVNKAVTDLAQPAKTMSFAERMALKKKQ